MTTANNEYSRVDPTTGEILFAGKNATRRKQAITPRGGRPKPRLLRCSQVTRARFEWHGASIAPILFLLRSGRMAVARAKKQELTRSVTHALISMPSLLFAA